VEKLGNKVKLELKGISKAFGGLKAVDDISFKIHQCEIVAIVGDNGAGKSTLIKVISGILQKDSGEIYIDGEKINITNAMSAKRYKIETVYQERTLTKSFDAATNLFLGREKFSKNIFGRVFKFLDFRDMKEEAKNLLNTLSIELKNINSPVNNLSGGEQRSIEIGRAAYWGGEIIIFDEPTNNLGVKQRQKVISLIKNLRDKFGVSIIFISHNLKIVFDLADKIIVLRNGKKFMEKNKTETTENEVIAMMTGSVY